MEVPAAAAVSVVQRAAAGRLACPYCQAALTATVLDARRVQLRCPSCGFAEAPDLVEREPER
ncbi:MAG: hypothetical protein ACR2JY_19715 [Chloroflexota bacterium]